MGLHRLEVNTVSRKSLRKARMRPNAWEKNARLFVDAVQQVRVWVETAEVFDTLVERFSSILGRA